jgi:hypothetical protein
VALRANLLLVQRLLFRSAAVEIAIEGHARAVVRHAKLWGLIGEVRPQPVESDTILRLSGPVSLFRRTLLYGRAMASLLPLLSWCRRFRLRAECWIDEERAELQVATGDPIFPSGAPRRFDSKLEHRFARDFARAAPEFDLIREPEPVSAGGTLIFPDFALEHRIDRSRRYLLEIAGFWTPDYIEKTLSLLRNAAIRNLILCIDAERNCADRDLPPDAIVIRFKRRIDPAAVLAAIGALD